MVNQNIIVTFTSWKKRIKNIPKVLDTILKQTMLPGKIVLNLSSSEFPNKEGDLPEDVVSYLKKNNVEIYWVDGENTRQWKKIIPTMKRYPDKWTVCIDDDRLYDSNLIEKLWEKHLEFPNNPITTNGSYKVSGCLQHCGCGTLECAKFYDNFNGIDVNEIMTKTESSDTMYTYLLNRNGYPLIYCGMFGSKPYNEVDALSKTVGTYSTKKHLEIWNWLNKKYGELKTHKVNTIVNEYAIVSSMYGDVTSIRNKKPLNKRVVVRKFRN